MKGLVGRAWPASMEERLQLIILFGEGCSFLLPVEGYDDVVTWSQTTRAVSTKHSFQLELREGISLGFGGWRRR